MRIFLVVPVTLASIAGAIHAQDVTLSRATVGSGGGKSADNRYTSWMIAGQCAYAASSDGVYQHSGGLLGRADSLALSVDDAVDQLPYRFELSQNYPNPFNPATTIEYSVPSRVRVSIDIFNIVGQKVKTLVDREVAAGSYTVIWEGTSDSGTALATGIYLYRFKAADHIETKKMLLLK